MPSLWKASGCLSGSSTPSLSRSCASSTPPMSSQPTSGICTITSRIAEGCTRFSAAMKSSRSTASFSSTSAGMVRASRSSSGMIRRTVSIAASRASAAMSAPTKPWVVRASSPRSTPSPSGMPRVWMPMISRRPFSSGTPMTISRSNRPGRRSASSIASGRLVAAMTTTFTRELRPSIKVSSWATSRFSVSPWTFSRLGAIESISSMKMIEGAAFSASSNTSRSRFSLSP